MTPDSMDMKPKDPAEPAQDRADTSAMPEPQFERFRRRLDDLSGEQALDQVARALKQLIAPRVPQKKKPSILPSQRASRQASDSPHGGSARRSRPS
ncbi:MAG: hypothetical protein KIS84_02220 [Dokdonella sp.]|nr:hypothetical protein [Dokdonella sp.]